MNRPAGLCSVFAIMSLAACPNLFPQGGPPLLTDDPGTPGAGRWEINLAFSLEKVEKERLFEAPLFDLNYGWGDHLQLKFEIPWLVRTQAGEETQSGLGNSAFGLKWRFRDEDRHGMRGKALGCRL